MSNLNKALVFFCLTINAISWSAEQNKPTTGKKTRIGLMFIAPQKESDNNFQPNTGVNQTEASTLIIAPKPIAAHAVFQPKSKL